MADSIRCDVCFGKGRVRTIDGYIACQRCAGDGIRDPTQAIIETTITVDPSVPVVRTFAKDRLNVDLDARGRAAGD